MCKNLLWPLSWDHFEAIIKIFHEKFLYLEFLCYGSELDSDSRQFVKGNEDNDSSGAAAVILCEKFLCLESLCCGSE